MLDLCPDVQDYLVSDIDPALVSGTNRERYKFKCKMCGDIFERAADNSLLGCKLGHEFEQTPYLVSKGYWCPLCAIVACKDNDRLISARSRAESLGRI